MRRRRGWELPKNGHLLGRGRSVRVGDAVEIDAARSLSSGVEFSRPPGLIDTRVLDRVDKRSNTAAGYVVDADRDPPSRRETVRDQGLRIEWVWTVLRQRVHEAR